MNPVVVILRHESYSHLDEIIRACNFTSKITNNLTDIKLLYNEHNNVLITIGNGWTEYSISHLMIKKCFQKWLHFKPEDVVVPILNLRVLSCYIANLPKRIDFRPQVSAFTTSYKSGDKIMRPYHSLLGQKMMDWEWVIIDDTDGYENWEMLCKLNDPRIRCYKRNGNSGSIGNVKNEASSLCRGKYLIELDHDDELLPDCCGDIVKGFEWDESVGFIYMDFAELYEDLSNYQYGEGWAYGFGSYHRQFVKGKWLYSAISCPINNVTMKSIVSVPNHPRIWRKTVLEQVGGYSEAMPVADDYEVLVRTFLMTKMLRIPKLAYLQYKNNGGNNFSLIRAGEITKLQKAVSSHYNEAIDKYFQDKPKTKWDAVIWKRNDWIDTKVNLVHNFDYDLTILVKSIGGLSKVDKKERVDVILVLSFDFKTEEILGQLGLTWIKFHILAGASDVEIEQYFHRCYRTTEKYEIVD